MTMDASGTAQVDKIVEGSAGRLADMYRGPMTTGRVKSASALERLMPGGSTWVQDDSPPSRRRLLAGLPLVPSP
jgi:imidazolonepropionase-like amidohydrolase